MSVGYKPPETDPVSSPALTAHEAKTRADNVHGIDTELDAVDTALAARQPLDSDLTAIAALSTTSFGRSVLEAASATALRTLAGTVIGTDVQAYDAELAALAGLTSAANKGIQFTGSGTAGTYDLTTFAKTILDDADAATARATLGVTDLLPIVVRKTADETVNNSAVLQNDDHLVLPVLASSTYQFELWLLTSAANATADWQFAWTVPAGTTMFWGGNAQQGASATTALWDEVGTGVSQQALRTEATTLALGSAAVTGGIFLRGVIRVAGTAGNVQFRWAQNTANATDSKLLTDSAMIARKIA